MRRLSGVLFVMILCLCSLSAQSLSGVVKDEAGQPIAYATVSLLTADSTLVAGEITDEQGHYSLPSVAKGRYVLQVSFVGYQTDSKSIIWKGEAQEANFVLSEQTQQLAAVEVKASRPLIERQMDKIVMNVANSAFANGNNGKEVLQKAPGVRIDKDGNITVNGKAVEVYIDNRPSYLSGEQLKGLLQGTDGATIDKIEIITNPSAKYDAAGQGGIINIKLKKNKSRGLSGMLSAAYGGMYFKSSQRYNDMDMVNLSLNYRSPISYTAVSLTQVYAGQDTQSDYQSTILDASATPVKTQTQSHYEGNFQYYMFKLAQDFYIDEKNTLGFILNVPYMRYRFVGRDSSDIHTQMTWGETPMQDIYTHSVMNNHSPQHTANINFTHVFNDSLSRELTANVDYNRYSGHSGNMQRNSVLLNTTPFVIPDALSVSTQQTVDIYSAKLDFQSAFWKTGLIECGAKWAMSNTFNNMQTDSTIGETVHATPTKYDYSEQVAALYITAAKQFGAHWNAKIGLRGELTASKGIFYENEQKQEVKAKPYFNLFPTAFVGYNPTDDWALSATYTRRIQRPHFSQLNPFVTYLDAHTYQCGNPDLRPAFNHQFEFSVGYSRYVSAAFKIDHTQDLQTYATELLSNGDQRQTWINFGKSTTYGGSVSLTEVPIVPKYATMPDGARQMAGAWLALTLNAECGGKYNHTDGQQKQAYSNHSVYGSIYGCLTAYMPKEWQLSVDCNWNSPIVVGYARWGSDFGMDIGLKKTILSKGLILSLNVKDLLRTSNWSGEMLGLPEGYSSTMSSVSNQQMITIGLTYMFGKQQFSKRRNVGNVDESGRLGGGGGLGGR